MDLIRRKWLWLVGIIVLLVALGMPALQILPYFKSYGSKLKLETTNSAAVLRFTLTESDRSSLTVLAEKLGLSWRGQDLAIPLSEESIKLAKSWQPFELDLSSSDSEITFSGGSDKLPGSSPEITITGEELMPPDAVSVIRISAIQDRYQLPGKEVFQYVQARGTLGLTLGEQGLGLIFAAKVKDEAGLRTALSSLKNTTTETGPGYSGVEAVSTGFTEQTLDGVVVETYNQAGLPYHPTFGVLGSYLVITSSPELWQAVKSNFDQGTSIAGNSRYVEAKKEMPSFSVGSVYLDLKTISARGLDKLKEDLAPLAKFDLGAELKASGVRTDKLESLFVSWFGVALTKDNFTPSRFVGRLRVGD